MRCVATQPRMLQLVATRWTHRRPFGRTLQATHAHVRQHQHTCTHPHAHAQTHTDSDTINTATPARKRAGAHVRRREWDRLACTPARTGRTNTRMRALAHTRLIAHQSRRPLAPLRSGHGPHVNMPTCDRGLSENMPTRDRGLSGNTPMRDRGLSGSDTIGLKVGRPQARPHTCTDGRAWVRTFAHRGACVGAI
jgi:hypothetical protein